MLSQIFKGGFNFFKKQSTLLSIAKDCLSVLDVPMAPLAHQDLPPFPRPLPALGSLVQQSSAV